MKKYSVYIWALLAFLFISFIGIMSYWYPVTLDEYYRWADPLDFSMIKQAYVTQVPRISVLFGPPIFIMGKWFFILVNSFLQFANALYIFYIVFTRLPNIKNLNDMPYFIIILCMSIYFVCSPSGVMFWLSGAINYTWTVFFFLLLLCFLRQMQTQKFMFRDSLFVGFCLFILGFIVGTSNEALSPIALGVVICFGLFCNFKKIKTPKALSFMIFGVVIGCLVFFSAPAHYYRITDASRTDLVSITLAKKLFFHLFHFNNFLKAQFFLPVLTFLFWLIATLDKDKRNFRDENYWFSLIFLLIGFFMAFILFVIPRAPLRAYYPASIMTLLAFLFLTIYYVKQYNFDFSKILCYIIIFISLILTPRFVIPHYVLHLQEQTRMYLNFGNQDKAEVVPYFVLKGPTDNLSIGLMDYANQILEEDGNYLRYFVQATRSEDW